MNATGSGRSEGPLGSVPFGERTWDFLDGAREDRLSLLASGCPDDATQVLLAELLLRIKQAVADNFLEDVDLGDALARGFGVETLNERPEFQQLTDLLAADVSDGSRTGRRLTPPRRLDLMVSYAAEMLRMQRASHAAIANATITNTAVTNAAIEQPTVLLVPDSGQDDEDELAAKVAQMIQEVVQKESNDMVEVLLRDVDGAEDWLPVSERSLDVDDLVYDIRQNANTVVTERSRSRGPVTVIMEKGINRVLLHRAVAKLKVRFGVGVRGRGAMKLLVDSVTALLLFGYEQEDEASVVEELAGLVQRYFGIETTGEDNDAALCIAIRDEAGRFLALTNWWQETRAVSRAYRVTLDVRRPPEDERRRTPIPQEDDETDVLLLVENLVSQLLDKGSRNVTAAQKDAIVQRLFQETLAQIPGRNVQISREQRQRINKAALRELKARWCCVDCILLSLILEEAEVHQHIAQFFTSSLTSPGTEQSAVATFFSSARKVFRRSHRVA